MTLEPLVPARQDHDEAPSTQSIEIINLLSMNPHLARPVRTGKRWGTTGRNKINNMDITFVGTVGEFRFWLKEQRKMLLKNKWFTN